MEKKLEVKPMVSQLIRKTKAWLPWCILLILASPLLAYAEPSEERYAYAKVFVEGTGIKHEYSYMRDVYLDVVAIPIGAVVEQDSGILFTEGNYKKSLSEIQVRALEFVEPHLKELGFEAVSDYQIFIYAGDKGKTHLDRATVEKFRVDSFDIPSKLSGPKAELHGAWMEVKAETVEANPTIPDKNTELPTEAPKTESTSIGVSTQESTVTADAEKSKIAANKKKKLEEVKRKAFAKKQSEQKKAYNEKKAKQKTDGRIIKEMIFGDSLKESQAKTWCGRITNQFLKSMETSNNKLISIGDCSCKPGGEPGSLQQDFRCGFPVTYRVLTNNAK